MDLGLRGKVAVVTGGSKGIGYAAAKVFLEEGAKVAICARHEEELRQAAGELEQLGPVYWEAVEQPYPESSTTPKMLGKKRKKRWNRRLNPFITAQMG